MRARIAVAAAVVAAVLLAFLTYWLVTREQLTPREEALIDEFPEIESADRGEPLYIADPMSAPASPPPEEGAYEQALRDLFQAQYSLEVRKEDLAKSVSSPAGDRIRQSRAAVIQAEDEVIRTRGLRGPGMEVQRGTLLLMFRDDATTDQIKAVLTKHGLVVRSGIPRISLFVVDLSDDPERTPEAEAMRLKAVMTRLRDGEDRNIIETAVPNVEIGETIVPLATVSALQQFFNGNHPLALSHFPEAWNFRDAIRKRGGRTVVGVLDVGFLPEHEDLVIARAPCGKTLKFHGTEVAGVIGAKFGNRKGVDGAAGGFADIVACSPEPPQFDRTGMTQQEISTNRQKLLFDGFIAGLYEFLRRDIRVVNASIGYNWRAQTINPLITPSVQKVVEGQGRIVRKLLRHYGNAVVVSAAGNDCRQLTAVECMQRTIWTSPFNWAALGPSLPGDPRSQNVIVVQAANGFGDRLGESNFGMISAIGIQIPTTVDVSDGVYGPCKGGTSCATPLVSATIALMLAYNPTLNVPQIRAGLGIHPVENRVSIDPANTVKLNAFIAVSRSSRRAKFDLANLNGDSEVDLKDFRLFNAGFKQLVGTGATSLDLNADGMETANEGQFARIDLNGRGGVARDDLDVMIAAWTDSSIDPSSLRAKLGQ